MTLEHVKPYDQKRRLRLLQAGGGLILFVLLVTRPALHSLELHESIEDIGFAVAVCCILGRLWCTLYIGDRKNSELVVSGPYSMTRNPLYFFSCLGAAGIGLMSGSLIMGAILCCFAYVALSRARAGEERYLSSRYGAVFEVYRARTPRFWPRPSLYSDHDYVRFSTKALKRTFVDCLAFVLVFPLFELVEQLQGMHVLPVWITAY